MPPFFPPPQGKEGGLGRCPAPQIAPAPLVGLNESDFPASRGNLQSVRVSLQRPLASRYLQDRKGHVEPDDLTLNHGPSVILQQSVSLHKCE